MKTNKKTNSIKVLLASPLLYGLTLTLAGCSTIERNGMYQQGTSRDSSNHTLMDRAEIKKSDETIAIDDIAKSLVEFRESIDVKNIQDVKKIQDITEKILDTYIALYKKNLDAFSAYVKNKLEYKLSSSKHNFIIDDIKNIKNDILDDLINDDDASNLIDIDIDYEDANNLIDNNIQDENTIINTLSVLKNNLNDNNDVMKDLIDAKINDLNNYIIKNLIDAIKKYSNGNEAIANGGKESKTNLQKAILNIQSVIWSYERMAAPKQEMNRLINACTKILNRINNDFNEYKYINYILHHCSKIQAFSQEYKNKTDQALQNIMNLLDNLE